MSLKIRKDGDWVEIAGRGTDGINGQPGTPGAITSVLKSTSSQAFDITFLDTNNTSILYHSHPDGYGRLRFTPSSSHLQVGGNITAFYLSDNRLKDDVKNIDNAVGKIQSLNGVTFKWNEKSGEFNPTENVGKYETGVIAQEVEKLNLPGVTTTRENGMKAVRYEKLVPLLIEAIKELKDEIDDLKNQKN